MGAVAAELIDQNPLNAVRQTNGVRAIQTLPPERDLSFLEVSLFCLVEHLQFRQVVSLDPYPALRAFAQRFGARTSARATAYAFDFPAT